MISEVFVALLAVASVHGQKTYSARMIMDGADQNSVVAPVGADKTFTCELTTNSWTVRGTELVEILKQQPGDDVWQKVANQRAVYEEFQKQGRFESTWLFPDDFKFGDTFTFKLNVKITGLVSNDTGVYKCRYMGDQNVELASGNGSLDVQTKPTNVELKTQLLSTPPNSTRQIMEEHGNGYKWQFNWNDGEMVKLMCHSYGGYPVPNLRITKNGGEDLNAQVTSHVDWEGDKAGQKSPKVRVEAVVSEYVPKRTDKDITCTAGEGDMTVEQKAKVSFGEPDLEVTCKAISAKTVVMDDTNLKVACDVKSSTDLAKVQISKPGIGEKYFNAKKCEESFEETYTDVVKTVFCRWQQVGNTDKYQFILKFSRVNVDTAGDYMLHVENADGESVSTPIKIPTATKAGATTGVSGVIPSVALLLVALFLAL